MFSLKGAGYPFCICYYNISVSKKLKLRNRIKKKTVWLFWKQFKKEMGSDVEHNFYTELETLSVLLLSDEIFEDLQNKVFFSLVLRTKNILLST
jgi:hypothetical protein